MSQHRPMDYLPEERAQWEKDFGRPFPKTMKEWNAWQIENTKRKIAEMRMILADLRAELRELERSIASNGNFPDPDIDTRCE